MPTIREYLISLGAEVDNKSMSKFNQALKGSAVSVAKFGAGMAALMTMVAKTSISLDKTALSYEKMAEKQKKSLELIRAQETALKILGKTEKEVNADKQLKEQYKTLKAIGQEIKLPTAAEGEKTLRGLLQDFDKFRMVSTYAMNWINHEFLSKIQAPLAEVRRGLQKFTEKLKMDMPRISNTVATVFSSIFRLAMSGVTAVGKLIQKIDSLPGVVKAAGAAIAAAFGLSKLNPAIIGLTAVLLILEDYQTWLRGGESALGDFYQAMQDGKGYEYMKDQLGQIPDKIKAVQDEITTFMKGFFTKGEEAATTFLKGISEHDFSADGTWLSKFFGQLVTDMLTFLDTNIKNGSEFAVSWSEVGGRLVAGLGETIGTAIQEFPWMDTFSKLLTGANSLLSVIGDILFGEEGAGDDPTKYQGLVSNFEETARNIIAGIGAAFMKIEPSKVATEVSGFFENIFALIGKAFSADQGKNADELITALTLTASEIGQKIFMIIGQTFDTIPWDTAGTTIGNAINAIFGRIVTFLNLASAESGLVSKGVKDSMKSVAQSLLTFLGSAFQSLDLSQVQDAISIVFGMITDFMKQAIQTDPEGKSILQGAFTLASDVMIGVANAVLGGIAQVDFASVGSAIGGFISRLFEFITTAFSESTDENGNTTSVFTRVGGLFDTAVQIAKGIVDGTCAAFDPSKGGLDVNNVTDAIKTVVGGLFGLIERAFSKENLTSLKQSGLDLLNAGKEIALGIINGIADGFGDGGIQFGEVVDVLSNVVNTVFDLIGKLFDPANVDAVVGAGLNLVTVGVNVVHGILQAIGTGFSQIKTADLGKNIGLGISQLFATLGSWLSQQGSASGSGLALATEAFKNIAMSLVKGIGNALRELHGSGAIKTFATGLVQFFKDGVAQMSDDLKNNKISFTDIGAEIGTAIGNAIKIGTEFIQTIITELWSWLTGGGYNDLVEIGKAIVQGILAGIGSIYDAIMESIFGDAYTKGKETSIENAQYYARVSEIMDEQAAAGEDKDFNAAKVQASMEKAWTEQRDATKVSTVTRSGMPYTYNMVMKELDDFWMTGGLSDQDRNELSYFDLENLNEMMKRFRSPEISDDMRSNLMVSINDLLLSRRGFSGYEDFLNQYYNNDLNATIPQITPVLNTQPADQQYSQLKNKIETKLTVPVDMSAGGGGGTVEEMKALGGRFSTATHGVFGEDGTEYIIPITKPARAKALITQMFKEMGANANGILAELGVNNGSSLGGPGSSWSSQPAAMYPSAGGSVKSNSDNNVNVPTTINVYGSGDALMAGQAAARASQSNVLRAVRGVVGA